MKMKSEKTPLEKLSIPSGVEWLDKPSNVTDFVVLGKGGGSSDRQSNKK